MFAWLIQVPLASLWRSSSSGLIPLSCLARHDEAFAGHPLANRGLHPYGAFQIRKFILDTTT
jgi:hypothetical protein